MPHSVTSNNRDLEETVDTRIWSRHQTIKIPVNVTFILGRCRVQRDNAVGVETGWTNEGSEFESQ
jgi:hypothetical protein